jgi:hypothetical protein
MKERKHPIKPTQEIGQQYTDWRNKNYFIKSFFKLKVFVEVVLVMLTKRVGWMKAQATIDQEYYQRCLNTGKANFLYRPADLSQGEIGPQSTKNFSGGWWDWLLIVLIILWLYRRIKNAKR